MRWNRWIAPTLLFLLVSSSAAATSGVVRTADGCELFVRVVGEGSETLVVPGGLFFGDALDSLADGRKIVLYDMRNRGRSCFERRNDHLGLQQDVDDLEAIRRHFGLDSFDVIGFSYLGKMVVVYALQHPGRIERIVQIGPGAMDMGTEFEPDPSVREAPADPGAIAELRKMREEDLHLTDPEEYCRREWEVTKFRLIADPEHASRLRASNCEMPNEWPTNLTRHYAHHFPSVQASVLKKEDLEPLEVPVLTIHGRKDRNSPYGAGREWAGSLPSARLITVDEAAHCVWVDEPGIVDEIALFLAGDWPEGAEIIEE